MEDYIDFLKKYKIIIVLYVVAFIGILYFIWRPEREEETSLFDISSVSEEATYDRFYSYYKQKLDELFLEANYSKIYNDYLLTDYKTKNALTEDNVESVIKYKCESFRDASTTSYTISNNGDVVIYNVRFINDNAENTLDIYEFTPYNFKIAFGSNLYNSSEDSGVKSASYVTSDFVKVTKEGLTFEITKQTQYDDFIEYGVKITNEDSISTSVNLIQNNNLVAVDSNDSYYVGSVSKNDNFVLEKGNYTEFTVSFKVSIENQTKLRYLRFSKIEKSGETKQIDINL